MVQKIPASREKVWEFFSSYANLQVITPPNMKINVISRFHGDKMYPGQLIEYRLRPVRMIGVYWLTEITHVKDGEYFVDEQRYGPYRFWHHHHQFRSIDGGTEMTDTVHYRVPFGVLGDVINRLMVKRQLENIFRFRGEKIEELFGKWSEIGVAR